MNLLVFLQWSVLYNLLFYDGGRWVRNTMNQNHPRWRRVYYPPRRPACYSHNGNFILVPGIIPNDRYEKLARKSGARADDEEGNMISPPNLNNCFIPTL
eukprot:scaffold14942_cov47-Attheya_sp.AAC.4